MSIFQEPRGTTYQANPEEEISQGNDVYGDLDASLTLLLHGLESDWIEDEMADDDDFKYALD